VTDLDPTQARVSVDAVAPGLSDGDKGVVVQRDRKTYAIAPHFPCGLVTPELLRRVADVAERYHCQALKLTSAERIVLVGLREQDIDAAWRDLGLPPGQMIGDFVRSVRVCPGTDFCKRGQQDSLAIGKVLDGRYHGVALPGKCKMSVAGCPNQCTETSTKDVGLVGTKKGWDILVGGNGGANPRLGTRIARNESSERALELVEGIMAFYRSNARPRERLCKTLARVGLDALTESLGLPKVLSSRESVESTASA
jgi:NAD(P)H-nitrite reductase large subunit